MATYYIAYNGDDINGTGIYANPWKTITKAATVAAADDTVVCKDGTWTYSGTFNDHWFEIYQGGTVGHPVRYVAENPGQAIFDGNYSCVSIVLFSYSGTFGNIIFEDIEFKKARWQGLYAPDATTITNLTIRHCHIHHICQRLEYDTFNGANAIYSGYAPGHCQNWIVERCLIHDIGRLNPEVSGYVPTYQEETVWYKYWDGSQWVYPNPSGYPSPAPYDYWTIAKNNWQHDHGFYSKGAGHICRNNIFYNINHGWAMTVTANQQFINNTCLGPPNPMKKGNLYLYFEHDYPPNNMKVENNIFYDGGMEAAIWAYSFSIPASGYSCSIRNNITNQAGLVSNYDSEANLSEITYADNLLNTDPVLTGNGKPYDIVSQEGFTISAPGYPVNINVQKVLDENVDIEPDPDSPVLGAAYAADLPTLDYNGVTRPLPVGSAGDVGAYELSESITPPPDPEGNELEDLVIEGSLTLIDTYDLDLAITNQALAITDYPSRAAQSFWGTGLPLDVATFKLYRVNNPSGYLYYDLYLANTEAPYEPTGSILATSEAKELSTITDSALTLYPLAFPTPYTPSDDVGYHIVARVTGGDANNRIRIGLDTATYTDDGIPFLYTTSWAAIENTDLPYKVETYTYRNVWKQTLTTEPGQVTEDGEPLTERASIALVNANAGSWYWASNVIYISPSSGTPSGKQYLWQLPAAQVAEFPCDEGTGTTITDSINALTGTITSGSWGIWRGTDVINFDGADTKVGITAATPINGLTQFSYSCWIHPLIFTDNFPRIFSRESASGSAFYLCINSDGYIGGIIFQTDGGALTSGAHSCNLLNRWTHVCVTFDNAGSGSDDPNTPGSRYLRIYTNGVEITYSQHWPLDGTIYTSSNDLYIGNMYDGSRAFKGMITKLNIWNKALTSAEIVAAYGSEWPYDDRIYVGPDGQRH